MMLPCDEPSPPAYDDCSRQAYVDRDQYKYSDASFASKSSTSNRCLVFLKAVASFHQILQCGVGHQTAVQLMSVRQQLLERPWSTIGLSQLAAWTTNRSRLVASLQKAVHLEGSVIRCHRCITSHSGSVPASPDMRPFPPSFVSHACHPPPPSLPHPTHHRHDQLHIK